MLTVDSREPHDIVNLLIAEEIPTTYEQLDVGDYSFVDAAGEPCLITRKAADLLESVFSGHFSDEIQRCLTFLKSSGGGKLWWLQEGAWIATDYKRWKGIAHIRCSPVGVFTSDKSHDASPALIPALQVSLQTAGIYYATSASLWESALAIVTIYRRGQQGWPSRLPLRIPKPTLRWHRDDEWQHTTRLMGLWPRLSERQAAALLQQHGTIANIIECVRQDTLVLPGIGPKMLESFKEVVLK